MRRPLSLIAALGLGALSPARAEAPFAFATTPGQLPKTAVPDAYDIALDLDPRRLRFTGHETVTLDLRRPARSLTLNQAGLTLTRAALDGGGIARVRADEAAQTATLDFPATIPAGRHILSIDWSGPILTSANGLYVDDYTDAGGRPHRMIVTQFEVADARRMFPGWDEPAFKARFRLAVTLPSGLVAVSNMPIEAARPTQDGRQHVRFATTPRMSTYLLALVAGDLGAVHGQAAGTPISIYAPAGREQQGQSALADAEAILPYYNAYFGVRYPLPKMDMLAIPGNYEAGAMENWGALTYIDNALLFDPRSGTQTSRELIETDVAHEMAHQWSGDLVTMGWWDDLWLNEGFATWMETKATDRLHPEWEVWPRQHAYREETLDADALASTHPIQQPIRDVSEADSAFDAISYGKGSLVIRMIEGWLGEDRFRDGMRAYMKTHAYSNTTSQDLWNALQAASGEDVGAVARSFTEQPGIPLVDVSLACHDGHGTYTLRQGRFSIPAVAGASATSWRIPLVYGGPGLPTRRLLLSSRTTTLDVDNCTAPLKFDLGESSYVRVRYDAAASAPLRASFAAFAPVDRANLLGDRFAMFASGQDDLAGWLDLAAPRAQERDTAVLDELIERLRDLDHDEIGSPSRTAFQRFARSLLAPAMARLGWDPQPGESVLDAGLRPRLIEALGAFGDEDVRAEAKRRFAAWRDSPASLAPSLVGPVTSLAMRDGDAATWQVLAERIRASTETETRLRLFGAIAMARDPALVARNVDLAVGGAIPNGRIGRALAEIARESEQPELVFSLVHQRLAVLRDHLAPGSQDKLLAAIASSSVDPATAQALRADPASSATTGAKVATAHALDEIATGAALRRRVQAELGPWLASHG